MSLDRRGFLLSAAAASTIAGSGALDAGTAWKRDIVRSIDPAIEGVRRYFRTMAWGGRTYRIYVSAPTTEPPAAGFPVIYAMDGNALFDPLSIAVATQARYRDYSAVEPAIVVGIGYDELVLFNPRRAYDLSPPDPRPLAGFDPTAEEREHGIGGADEMLAFIAKRVAPAVEGEHRGDPARRAVFGHSRGGLFVLHALFTRDALFRTYLASSPSIWWHDRLIHATRARFTAAVARHRVDARLLISMGMLERGDAMMDNAEEMAMALGGMADRGLDVEWHPFPDENHLSVIPAAVGRAVRFALARTP